VCLPFSLAFALAHKVVLMLPSGAVITEGGMLMGYQGPLLSWNQDGEPVPEAGGSMKAPSAWGPDLGVGAKAARSLFLQKQEVFLCILLQKTAKGPLEVKAQLLGASS